MKKTEKKKDGISSPLGVSLTSIIQGISADSANLFTTLIFFLKPIFTFF
jgi:hypothetical protein